MNHLMLESPYRGRSGTLLVFIASDEGLLASDKYGLPTAMDDEVILGLIQLTGKAEFSKRKVLFTRYELLRLLNWTDDTRNYNRLEQSLNRWLGVTLYYDKAWWSKEERS